MSEAQTYPPPDYFERMNKLGIERHVALRWWREDERLVEIGMKVVRGILDAEEAKMPEPPPVCHFCKGDTNYVDRATGQLRICPRCQGEGWLPLKTKQAKGERGG